MSACYGEFRINVEARSAERRARIDEFSARLHAIVERQGKSLEPRIINLPALLLNCYSSVSFSRQKQSFFAKLVNLRVFRHLHSHNHRIIKRLRLAFTLLNPKSRSCRNCSMIRIETSVRGDLVTFALIGRLQSKNLPELKRLIETRDGNKKIVLDLKEVRLVDREAIMFLANFDKHNATIRNCPPYIREWIRSERAQH
jgi:ABC-type transporter Mla MlaB component